MKLLTAFTVAIIAVLVVVEHGEAANKCHGNTKGAMYYRLAAWGHEDDLQLRPTLKNYRPGRIVRNCARAKFLANYWHRIASTRYAFLRKANSDPRFTINWVFRSEASFAYSVAMCESNVHISVSGALKAKNGQYRGMFQMGGWGRDNWAIWRGQYRYYTIVDQVKAAYRMKTANSWSHWACA